MKKEIVIDDCISIMRNKTPQHFDCGLLCSAKCCKGDGKGMVIFPGEEKFLDGRFEIFENGDRKIAVCNGSCDRKHRPLSCMIYPFFPIVETVNGKKTVRVIPDPRADCPIISGGLGAVGDFRRHVRMMGEFMLLNPETAEFLENISDELSEYEELRKKLLG